MTNEVIVATVTTTLESIVEVETLVTEIMVVVVGARVVVVLVVAVDVTTRVLAGGVKVVLGVLVTLAWRVMGMVRT